MEHNEMIAYAHEHTKHFPIWARAIVVSFLYIIGFVLKFISDLHLYSWHIPPIIMEFGQMACWYGGAAVSAITGFQFLKNLLKKNGKVK